MYGTAQRHVSENCDRKETDCLIHPTEKEKGNENKNTVDSVGF
jgi:hypothetical protein